MNKITAYCSKCEGFRFFTFIHRTLGGHNVYKCECGWRIHKLTVK